MRSLILILAVCVAQGLVGCGKGMTNDEIIKETKKCEDAGMTANCIWPEWYSSPTGIVCVPKKR